MVDLRSNRYTGCYRAAEEQQKDSQLISYRSKEHGEKVDHGFHVEAPFGSNAGCRQEHQAADGWKQHLGDEGTHGEDELEVEVLAEFLTL